MCDTKYRPVVGYSAEVGILGIRKLAVVNELLANDGILTSLVGGAGRG